MTNTSVENLSGLMAYHLYKSFKPYSVVKVRVTIEETRGQSASSVYGDPLS